MLCSVRHRKPHVSPLTGTCAFSLHVTPSGPEEGCLCVKMWRHVPADHAVNDAWSQRSITRREADGCWRALTPGWSCALSPGCLLMTMLHKYAATASDFCYRYALMGCRGGPCSLVTLSVPQSWISQASRLIRANMLFNWSCTWLKSVPCLLHSEPWSITAADNG